MIAGWLDPRRVFRLSCLDHNDTARLNSHSVSSRARQKDRCTTHCLSCCPPVSMYSTVLLFNNGKLCASKYSLTMHSTTVQHRHANHVQHRCKVPNTILMHQSALPIASLCSPLTRTLSCYLASAAAPLHHPSRSPSGSYPYLPSPRHWPFHSVQPSFHSDSAHHHCPSPSATPSSLPLLVQVGAPSPFPPVLLFPLASLAADSDYPSSVAHRYWSRASKSCPLLC